MLPSKKVVADVDAGIVVVELDTGSRASKETRTLDRIASNKNKATRLVPVYLCLLHQHLCQMLRWTVHSLTQQVPIRFRHKVLGVSGAH